MTPAESAPVQTTELPGIKLLSRGKVRDVYDLGDALLGAGLLDLLSGEHGHRSVADGLSRLVASAGDRRLLGADEEAVASLGGDNRILNGS